MQNVTNSSFTPYNILCACALKWIGTALDKWSNLLLLSKVLRLYHPAGLWGKDYYD